MATICDENVIVRSREPRISNLVAIGGLATDVHTDKHIDNLVLANAYTSNGNRLNSSECLPIEILFEIQSYAAVFLGGNESTPDA